MRTLTALIILLTVLHCAHGQVNKHLTLAELATANQAKLSQLSVGTSKDAVLTLIGVATAETRDGIVNNPWSTEAFSGPDGMPVEVLLYVTRKNQPFTPVRRS